MIENEFVEKNRGRIERDRIILETIHKAGMQVIAGEALDHLEEACDIIDKGH